MNLSQLSGFGSSSTTLPIDDRLTSLSDANGDTIKSLSIYWHALTGQTPTIDTLSDLWIIDKNMHLTEQQLPNVFMNVFVNAHPELQLLELSAQVRTLISKVWNIPTVNDDWVNIGVNAIQSGLSWGDALAYLANAPQHLQQMGQTDPSQPIILTQNFQPTVHIVGVPDAALNAG